MANVRTSGKAGREPSWTKSAKLSRVDGERLAANVANALAALRNDTDLRGAIGFDEMKRAAVFRRPWRDRPPLKRVTDNDATAMQEHLQLSGLPRIGKDAVFQAIQSVAVEKIKLTEPRARERSDQAQLMERHSSQHYLLQ